MDAALAQSLATRHGTPFYAYDLAVVKSRTEALFAALPAGASVCYSFKANPMPAIARQVRQAGCRAEITSEGELAAALAAGYVGTEMLFGGPGKTRHEITAALAAGIRLFSCESFRDLALLSALAVAEKIDVQVLLRVNPAEAPDARLAMSGVESQFGFEEPLLTAPAARERVLLPGLDVCGIHIYFGTQVAGVEALTANTQRAIAAAERVQAALGFHCRILNAGGGFPWPYANDHTPPNLSGLREKLETVWQASTLAQAGAQIWFESGRYLCAGSGWLVAQVTEIKALPNKTFIILDTGIHHLGGMAGLGRVPRGAVTVQNLSRDVSGEPPISVDLVGPLCTPLDCLARGLKIPPVTEGDLIGIPNVGAYGITASLLGFLSHPPPLEIAHENGQEREIWRLRYGHERHSS
jgi:diaminopimelate decarboxylase